MNKTYILTGALFVILFILCWKHGNNPGISQTEITELVLPIKDDPGEKYVYELGSKIQSISPEMHDRDRRVLDKLQKFKKETSNINAEKIALEQERISQRLQEVKNQVFLEPKKDIFVDEQGEAWERLDYGQGIIRYNFAEENRHP